MATKDYLSDIFSLGDDDPPQPPSGADLLASALKLAGRGFKVFPLRAGTKLPIHTEFYDVATSDPDKVRSWWVDPVTGWIAAHNIGIATDDMIVVDIDCKGGKPGEASYAALDCPATLTQRTPSGGRHAFFSGPSRSLSVGKLGDGLDIRSAHGYVAGAGSWLDAGGLYEIEHDLPIAACPQHVLDKLDAPRERSTTTAPATDLDTEFALARAARYLATEAPVAIEGMDGDGMVYRIANIVKDMGLSQPATLDAMIEHYMPRCAAPFSPAEQIDWFAVKVENAFTYALSSAGSQSPAVDLLGVDEIPPPVYREGSTEAQRIVRATSRRTFKRLGDPSLLVGPEWLVKPYLPRTGIVLLAGQSQVGKSFLALDLAGALANGSDWFGAKPRDIVGSLYVAAEGEQTIGGRLEAVRLTRLGGMAQASVPVFPDNLDDIERADDPRQRVQQMIEHLEWAITSARETMADEALPPLGVVFVDTLGDAFQVDDNDTATVKALMSGLGRLARKVGILIVGITHFGKDDRAGVAGTYNWKAGADVVLAATGEVNETAGTVKRRQLVLNKSRYVETGFISAFDLVACDIGMDADGAPARAATIRATSAKPKAKKPSPHAELLEECLFNAMVDEMIEVRGRHTARRKAVYNLFKDRVPGSKDTGNVSRKFQDATDWAKIDVLIEDGEEYIAQQEWPHDRLP